MNTSWQLCIVDYDRVKGNFKGLDEFLDKCETSPSKSDLMNGKVSIYKCALKNGGFSVCQITEGQAFMFEFYRSKK